MLNYRLGQDLCTVEIRGVRENPETTYPEIETLETIEIYGTIEDVSSLDVDLSSLGIEGTETLRRGFFSVTTPIDGLSIITDSHGRRHEVVGEPIIRRRSRLARHMEVTLRQTHSDHKGV